MSPSVNPLTCNKYTPFAFSLVLTRSRLSLKYLISFKQPFLQFECFGFRTLFYFNYFCLSVIDACLFVCTSGVIISKCIPYIISSVDLIVRPVTAFATSATKPMCLDPRLTQSTGTRILNEET